MSNQRWRLWIPLLLVTLGLSFWPLDDSDADAQVVPPVARSAPLADARLADPGASAGRSEQALDPLVSRELQNDVAVFGVQPRKAPVSTAPAAPPPPRSVEGTAGAAPQLPLRFIGRMVQKDQPVLFLTWGERNLAMRIGDVAEATYRLESIEENRAEFTFIPAGLKQTLSLNGGG